MLRRALISFWLTLCLAILPSLNAHAASSDEILRTGFQQLLDATKQASSKNPVALAKATRPILEQYIDFPSLTRRAFGISWKDLSPTDQKDATQLFSEVVIRSYASKIKPEQAPSVKFSAPKNLDANHQEVVASVNNAGTEIQVSYRVESKGKSWMIYEILVEGVSLTNSYRSQFDAIRSKSGAKSILESLRGMIR